MNFAAWLVFAGRIAENLLSREDKPIHPDITTLLAYHDGELEPKRAQKLALYWGSVPIANRKPVKSVKNKSC